MIKRYRAAKHIGICSLAGATLVAFLAGCAATGTRESTGGYVDDAAITAKVKTAIASDSQLNAIPAMQIRVETYKGVVQLSGFVNSAQTSERAALDASHVAGVKEVENDLVVKTQLGAANRNG
jgi:hyperosmotically inducible periplasmic protein